MLPCGGGLKGFRAKEIGYCTRKTRYVTIHKIIVIDTLQKRMTAIQINYLDMGYHVISDLDAQEWFFVGCGKQTVNHGVYFHAEISLAISGHSAFRPSNDQPRMYPIPGAYETPPFYGPDMCAIIPQSHGFLRGVWHERWDWFHDLRLYRSKAGLLQNTKTRCENSHEPASIYKGLCWVDFSENLQDPQRSKSKSHVFVRVLEAPKSWRSLRVLGVNRPAPWISRSRRKRPRMCETESPVLVRWQPNLIWCFWFHGTLHNSLMVSKCFKYG